MRLDSRHPPLDPPYHGYYHVISRQDTTFVLDICSNLGTVLVNLRKPAHVPLDDVLLLQ